MLENRNYVPLKDLALDRKAWNQELRESIVMNLLWTAQRPKKKTIVLCCFVWTESMNLNTSTRQCPRSWRSVGSLTSEMSQIRPTYHDISFCHCQWQVRRWSLKHIVWLRCSVSADFLSFYRYNCRRLQKIIISDSLCYARNERTKPHITLWEDVLLNMWVRHCIFKGTSCSSTVKHSRSFCKSSVACPHMHVASAQLSASYVRVKGLSNVIAFVRSCLL